MKTTANINYITLEDIKDKHLEQVPHCNSHFVAMLVFLVFVSSSFQLGPNSLIAIIVCGHSPSILQPQGTVCSLK